MTHAVAGAAIAQILAPRNRKALLAAITCAMLPDIDVVGFRLDVPYDSMLGHRGLTHSIAFACVVFVVLFWARRLARPLAISAALATLSHGFLDAFTSGGRGVAFFAPFSGERFFFPFTPIEVSPIGLRFFSARGLDVFLSELVWVWCPAALLMAVLWFYRRAQSLTK